MSIETPTPAEIESMVASAIEHSQPPALTDAEIDAELIHYTAEPDFVYRLATQAKRANALEAECERLRQAPLCGDHAQQWYCERNLITTESGCSVCDLVAAKESAERRADAAVDLLDFASAHLKRIDPNTEYPAIDKFLKECGK